MKTSLLKKAAFCGLLLIGLISSVKAQSYSENFDDITLLAGNGWVLQNNSSPVGALGWFQGTATTATPTPGPFNSYNGADNSYIAANFNSTGSTGTISNWLITPNRTLRNGDVFTFYTRKPTIGTGQTDYPDRLEVRMSTNGASTNVGTGATGLGDFTTLLLSVNPTLVANVYPQVWTQYTITISGLPAPTSGRLAFRYFVTGAGSLGSNSDYIGIDQVNYTPYVCPTFTMTTGGALTGAVAGTNYSLALTQTGALGAPNFAVTAGALPPGLTLGAGGTISGTPSATGTFNFTATVSDASGCSGSQNYSITVVCPSNPISFVSPPSLCDNAGPYTLVEGSPAGGTYSGTGVSGGVFDPSSGTQTITYDYTDPYGCSFNSNYTITVSTAPTVTQSNIPATCDNIPSISLSGGSPAGGVYSGTGVTGTDFSPSAGSQTITYTYTDVNGCVNSASTGITVNTAPTVTLQPFTSTCDNATSVALSGGMPSGGVYSGTGVTGTDFDPSVGTQTVTYSYSDANGCSNSASESITVNPAPTVAFNSPVTSLCINHQPLTLSGGTPTGGTYAGTGVSAGILDPAVAGVGTHIITYTFTDVNGCSAQANFSISVDACLGLNEVKNFEDLLVYPNPVKNNFIVSVGSGNDLIIDCINDIQGKSIQFDQVQLGSNMIQVNFSNQLAGVYLISGFINGEKVVIRLIKE